MKTKKANKVKGMLLRSYDGTYVFRVKDKKTFRDYDLMHSDLSIIIDDKDAYFYSNESEEFMVLDHSPATLGYKTKKGKVCK